MRTRHIDRTNHKNDGTGFEREMETTLGGYELSRQARLKKVCPPARVVGGGMFRKIIFLANPFLDFVGVWTERGGRAVFVEAKSTSTRRLPLNRSGGLTESQWDAIQAWEVAGAATGVLWHRADLRRVRFVSFALLARVIFDGEKSLQWDHEFDQVGPGQGLVLHDFLKNLSRAYYPGEK